MKLKICQVRIKSLWSSYQEGDCWIRPIEEIRDEFQNVIDKNNEILKPSQEFLESGNIDGFRGHSCKEIIIRFLQE